MTDILVRELQENDLSNGFLQILNSLNVSLPSLSETQLIFEKIKSLQNHHVFVCVKNSKIVGTATLLIEQKFIHNGRKVAHIEDVVVHIDFQKHGVGTALIEFLLDYSKQSGCYKVVLSCLNETKPFYEKIGFTSHLEGMRYDFS